MYNMTVEQWLYNKTKEQPYLKYPNWNFVLKGLQEAFSSSVIIVKAVLETVENLLTGHQECWS